MAKFPALPLWTDAYLADTRHLTAEQHGAYLLLLMEAWRRPSCSLPDDDEMLARLACLSSERWAINRDIVMAFWKFDGRKKEWTQSRLNDERLYVVKKSGLQRDKAANRWNKSKNTDAGTMPEAMPDGCPSDAPTPTPTIVDTNVSTSMSETGIPVSDASKPKASRRKSYPADFEQFWAAYPETVGQSKVNGAKAWERLSADDRAAALASLPAYAALLARRTDRPVKHVQGFLNGRMFETLVPAPRATSREQWGLNLAHARQNLVWSTAEWGPMPGALGCRVPADLLLPTDGTNWKEWTK